MIDFHDSDGFQHVAISAILCREIGFLMDFPIPDDASWGDGVQVTGHWKFTQRNLKAGLSKLIAARCERLGGLEGRRKTA